MSWVEVRFAGDLAVCRLEDGVWTGEEADRCTLMNRIMDWEGLGADPFPEHWQALQMIELFGGVVVAEEAPVYEAEVVY